MSSPPDSCNCDDSLALRKELDALRKGEVLKPAFATDYARMWDLVRYSRGDLSDAGLITLEEYAALVADETRHTGGGKGSPSPRRLESYDQLRKQLTELLAQVREKDAEIARLTAAKERTIDYIRTAMRSGGVKAAINATAWDRAHREGLQHAINAIFAEFEKTKGVGEQRR